MIFLSGFGWPLIKKKEISLNLMTELKSMTDGMNQEPIILDFEGFIVRPYDGWHLWFENPEGEGTLIRKIVFLVAIANLFQRTF